MNDKEIDIKGNELAIILRDSIIEEIPFIGSVAVKIISLQQRVRHERIISFIEDLVSSLKGIDKNEINWEYVSGQDFSDMIISIIQRVEQTFSKEKLHRFKEILIKEIKTPYSSNFKDTFLDILLKINEDQIKILSLYQKIDNGTITLTSYSLSNLGIRRFGEKRENEYINQIYFGMNQDVYDFLIQDLLSKYQLFDIGFIRNVIGHVMVPNVSPLGKELLLFIEST